MGSKQLHAPRKRIFLNTVSLHHRGSFHGRTLYGTSNGLQWFWENATERERDPYGVFPGAETEFVHKR